MTDSAFELDGVCKRYPFFSLEDVSFRLDQGQIMGFVGPNGAGKSTSIRILMSLVVQDEGTVQMLGHDMPRAQALAKRDVGFVSDDMNLYGNASLQWHIDFIRSIYPTWDNDYANRLLSRFNLHPKQDIAGFSHGERVKALLLLALARRPKLLVLDEPTSGLDPVARHEVLAEFMDVLIDDDRSILFSSHNTVDVEQISDQITFIDRGRIVDSADKESFLDRWRRLSLDVPEGFDPPAVAGVTEVTINGHAATVTSNAYTPAIDAAFASAGASVRDNRRMTLEEIFVANVMHSRRERENG